MDKTEGEGGKSAENRRKFRKFENETAVGAVLD